MASDGLSFNPLTGRRLCTYSVVGKSTCSEVVADREE